ncbi:LysR family transcriptional regulator [Enterocloster bolteae]|uniref:LysR family transcriptional regulator n=1 Tax=Enterocloster bolteae TaxID=208479 RepID=UPI002A802E22|nr:LysR family transcriptional regulator [Enterocloster bolteae]
MNLTDLEFVIAVERHGSISKAAKELFVAQPNLSKVIRTLEKEFGIVIFERTSKGVVTTSEGQAFIQKAKNIMKDVASLKGEFEDTAVKQEKLRISVPRASYITYAFTKYVNSIPHESQLSISFVECNSTTAINNILSSKYGLGIIRYEMTYEDYFLMFLQLKGLQHETVMEFDYQILLSADSPLALYPVIAEKDLDGYIEIVHGDTQLPSGEYLELPPDSGRGSQADRIYVCERGSQFDLLAMVPHTYMWVSPMPKQTLERYGLVQRSGAGRPRKMKDLLVYQMEHRKNRSEKAFIEMLKGTRDEIMTPAKL